MGECERFASCVVVIPTRALPQFLSQSTYYLRTHLLTCSGATSSGAARQQLPTALAGWPQKSKRRCRMTDHLVRLRVMVRVRAGARARVRARVRVRVGARIGVRV